MTGNVVFHAFSWTQNGGMVDLGTLGGATSSPTAVSSNGDVAGWAGTSFGTVHAVLWTRGR